MTNKTLYVRQDTTNVTSFTKAPIELIQEVAGIPCQRLESGALEASALMNDALLGGLYKLVPHLFVLPAHLMPGRNLNSRQLGVAQCRATYAHMMLDLEYTRQGYAWTHGDAYRDPRAHGEFGTRKGYSASRSLHKSRLAKDNNLFRVVDGKRRYVTTTDGHRPFGMFWIALGEYFDWPLEWGGSAGRHDGNHYSYGWAGTW